MRLDQQYVDRGNLWIDLKLIYRTMAIVLLGRGGLCVSYRSFELTLYIRNSRYDMNAFFETIATTCLSALICRFRNYTALQYQSGGILFGN